MRILSILPDFKDESALNYRINIGFINKLSNLCEYTGVTVCGNPAKIIRRY